ncbi:unnamed protein product [Ranitomeya imitator]|uniref:Putative zinc-finger domain-containing protein n=1 Tax=Ranitomeya imitator TaxID=111125 RepID=A0ABN9L5H7_9NEOB|nr:unnamed protein product [Ranitomeya imitator]
MESLRSVIASMEKGEFLASIDIQDVSLHIPILPSHQRFLRFVVQEDHFQFAALPFGLATAPRVFTKVMTAAVAILHTRVVALLIQSDNVTAVAYINRQGGTRSKAAMSELGWWTVPLLILGIMEIGFLHRHWFYPSIVRYDGGAPGITCGVRRLCPPGVRCLFFSAAKAGVLVWRRCGVARRCCNVIRRWGVGSVALRRCPALWRYVGRRCGAATLQRGPAARGVRIGAAVPPEASALPGRFGRGAASWSRDFRPSDRAVGLRPFRRVTSGSGSPRSKGGKIEAPASGLLQAAASFGGPSPLRPAMHIRQHFWAQHHALRIHLGTRGDTGLGALFPHAQSNRLCEACDPERVQEPPPASPPVVSPAPVPQPDAVVAPPEWVTSLSQSMASLTEAIKSLQTPAVGTESGEVETDYESEGSLNFDKPGFQESVDSLIEAVNQSLGIEDELVSSSDHKVSFKRSKRAHRVFSSHPEFEDLIRRNREHPDKRFSGQRALKARVFTKVMSTVVSILHSRGIVVLPYLDDLLIKGPTFQSCKENVDITLDTLSRLGCLLAAEAYTHSPVSPNERLGEKDFTLPALAGERRPAVKHSTAVTSPLYFMADAQSVREAGGEGHDQTPGMQVKCLNQTQAWLTAQRNNLQMPLHGRRKRLQELEQEYALKIQKLKEMQAQKMKEHPVCQLPVVEEQAEFALPQPSLHDLSQDKITLDSEENEPDDEDLSISVKERRRSFRDSTSFTKPNLRHAELTPYKDISSTPSKMATEGRELFLGLNIEEVRRLHSSSSNLTHLLSKGDTLLVSSEKTLLWEGMVDGGSPTLHRPIFLGTAPTCTGHTTTHDKYALALRARDQHALVLKARDQYSSVLNARDQYALVLISHDQYAHDQYALVLKAHDQYALVLRRLSSMPWFLKEIPGDVDLLTIQTKQTDAKPFPFGPYHSPLLVFKSYRFSTYFRTKEKLPLSSVSYSNMIEPKTFFCRFDLTGTCNDDECQWQHMRDCTLSRKQLFQDILSYNLDLIGCSKKSTDDEIIAAAAKYVDKLFGVNRDHMSMDLMSVLLVSKVNENLLQKPPHTTYKEKRAWKPMYWKKPLSDSTSSDEDDSSKAISGGTANSSRLAETKAKVPIYDAVVTSDDVRYFTNETDDISNLEASVLENPQDIQLWIKLTYRCLSQNEGTSSECLDSALNVLSRALEHNRDNPEIWSHYLKLFSQRGSREEIQEMCEIAVEYAPSFHTWWTFLTLENSFDGKDQICSRTLQYLVQQVEAGQQSELLSLQCLEVLLYRVHVNLFTGRLQNALAILQNALKSPCEKSIADHLHPKDRCLAWLSYIHLMEFNSLPANFYDPTVAAPSRIVNKEPFLIPWLNPQRITTDPGMLLALFEAAVFSCSDESLNAEERIEACLPLYKNMISLHVMLDRHFAAVNLCNQLLESSSGNCHVLDSLCSVYMKKGELEKATDVWIAAFRNKPCSAQIFYNVCRFLVQQDLLDCVSSLMEEFLTSLFENTNEKSIPADLLSPVIAYNFLIIGTSTDPKIRGFQEPHVIEAVGKTCTPLLNSVLLEPLEVAECGVGLVFGTSIRDNGTVRMINLLHSSGALQSPSARDRWGPSGQTPGYLLNFSVPLDFTAPAFKSDGPLDISDMQRPYLWLVFWSTGKSLPEFGIGCGTDVIVTMWPPFSLHWFRHCHTFNMTSAPQPITYIGLVAVFHANREEAADAYEAALGAVMQQDILQKLWMEYVYRVSVCANGHVTSVLVITGNFLSSYLVFTNSRIMHSKNKGQDSKHFADLLNRCLLTVPTRQPTPFSTAEYWTNYEFHNSVIYFYLSCVPQTQHSKILERFLSMMPMNLGLAIRVLKQEMDDNNVEIVKMQCKMFTYSFPMCLTVWKIAIAVETFLKGHKEVQHLYQRALQKLPLCAELWKDTWAGRFLAGHSFCCGRCVVVGWKRCSGPRGACSTSKCALLLWSGCERRAAGKQSGDVTALLSGRCAHSQTREAERRGQTAVGLHGTVNRMENCCESAASNPLRIRRKICNECAHTLKCQREL